MYPRKMMIIFKGFRYNNLYLVDFTSKDANLKTCLFTKTTLGWLWHRRLAHVGMSSLTPATNGGRWYFLLLMDDCSRYMWLQLLTSKDEAMAVIKKFKLRTEVESGKKLRVLRTDRGGEFTLVEFATYYVDQGVGQHHTAPYSPQQNGMVERRNQTVVGMA